MFKFIKRIFRRKLTPMEYLSIIKNNPEVKEAILKLPIEEREKNYNSMIETAAIGLKLAFETIGAKAFISATVFFADEEFKISFTKVNQTK